MWFPDRPPRIIAARILTQMPAAMRKAGVRTTWADANKGGYPVDCFLEGPAFDRNGDLLVVDIPHGRIFAIDAAGAWTLVAAYDGWPNGMKVAPDGRILIADYRRGLLELDRKAGTVRPLLATRNSESFKGCNDLQIVPDGTVYFTDQGQTGLHDPTGRVYRLSPEGRLDCLLANGPSPNGLALSPDGAVLYVAMTRDNAVWRLPLQRDGSVSKVGRFTHYFGTSGPDGLAVDREGQLHVAHASLGCVFVHAPNGECVKIIRSSAGMTCTNLALHPDGKRIVITESSSGSILLAEP
jgi:gluconolactonase